MPARGKVFSRQSQALVALGQYGYNADMFKSLAPRGAQLVLLTLLLAGVLLSACAPTAPPPDTPTPSATLDGTLRPYPTATVTATPLPTGFRSPTPSPTVTPTPTPVYYDVLEGDDMYAIGWRFKVSPAAIMTANPDVNPRAMGVGTTLLIPITPMPDPSPTPMVELSPTATPIFANIQSPDCYPDALGGLWCFVLVVNDQEEAVENVSGMVMLRAGEETRRESAIMPLNLLPAGAALPLIAYFQPPIPEAYTVTARVDFLLPVMPDDQRYLAVEIEAQDVSFSAEGRIAAVSGALTLPARQPETRYVWLNATAFDQDGRVVAVRRWDSPEQLSPGGRISFSTFLYSLGGPIDRVELLVEAQAVLEPAQEE
jgi:LysM repeat protein